MAQVGQRHGDRRHHRHRLACTQQRFHRGAADRLFAVDQHAQGLLDTHLALVGRQV
jgi:hypothetical protein